MPALLAEAQGTVRALEGMKCREAQRQLALTYQLIRMFAKRIGSRHDALRAADRAVTVVDDAGDVPLMAAGLLVMLAARRGGLKPFSPPSGILTGCG